LHQFGAGTHVGNVRDNNEDSYVCDPDKELWIVADGMGGLGFGEVASAISTYTVQSQLGEGHGVNQAIELAHKRIKEFATTEARGTNMGTTLVLLLSQGSLFNIFWVGDSRAYSFDGKLEQLTVDHSLVQNLIEQGELTAEEATVDPRKNAVTRALGVQELETVRADSISDKWRTGQKILLCSDGLTDCVDDKTIQAILSEESSDQEKVDNLITKALKQGGKDNITVLLISAPYNTKRADSDTHVPEMASDNTQISNDTQRKDTLNNQAIEPVQLSLVIEEGVDEGIKEAIGEVPTLKEEVKLPSIKNPSPKIEDTSAKESLWAKKQKWITAALLSITMILFARLTTADKPATIETPFTTGELIEQSTVSSMPQSMPMPNINWPTPGTVIQMGLFTKLTGAESQQSTLNKLGFSTHIEKKLESETIFYTVLLGPFREDEKRREALIELKKHNLAYFERPDSRY